jgi:hypothetical protein
MSHLSTLSVPVHICMPLSDVSIHPIPTFKNKMQFPLIHHFWIPPFLCNRMNNTGKNSNCGEAECWGADTHQPDSQE